MRVGVNTLFMIPGEVGGTETYTREILRAIARRHPDIKLILFTNRENDPVFRHELASFPQVTCHILPVTAMNRYSRVIHEQTTLPRALLSENLDLLWSPGYTCPHRSPCPQVVTIHDVQYRRFPDDFGLLTRIVTDTLARLAARVTRRILAVSAFSKSEIEFFYGADPARIDVTHLAADPCFAQPVTNPSLPGNLLNQPLILCVSNTYPHKNMDRLVEAYGRIQSTIPHHLVLIGKARRGEPAILRALAGVADRSRFHRLERVSRRAELIGLYQQASLFVFPSLYEGFGLPTLEAMMAGTPVLTAREASIPELGGDTVRYADVRNPARLADAIRDLLAMPTPERDAMIGRARERAHSFSWDRTALETVQSFRHALGA